MLMHSGSAKSRRSVWMEGWTSGFVATNGVRLHYLRSGGPKPPILLAHGALDDARCWARVAEALAPTYDVIAVDARGHGRSEAPGGGYELTSQAEDLAGVITALRLEQPALLGHSMGAEVAPVLAGTHPDLLGAILLENPGPWWTGWPGTAEEQAFLMGERERYEQLARQPRTVLIADRRRKRPDWTEAEREAWADAKVRASPYALQAFDPELDAGVDWPAVVGQITCRALLIRSDPATGGIVDQQAAEALQRMLPHLEIAYIPGASHSIRRSNLARFMEVVETFLAPERGRR
jgi:pimeloyl-ACP methyl ester carboxylesterase